MTWALMRLRFGVLCPSGVEEVGEVEAVVELGPPDGEAEVLDAEIGGLF